MQLIQHQELASAQATITFSSIPQTYTDLFLVLSVRLASDVNESILLGLNGTTANFAIRYLQGNGGTAYSGNLTRWIGSSPDSAWTANSFSNTQVYFPNYTSATSKSYSVTSVAEQNTTTAYQDLGAGLWTDNTAISSIEITAAANFVQYSSATLYGIRRYSTSAAPKATGGIITFDAVNNKWIHAFTASGTFTPTQDLTNVDYLVVAGGGSGGGSDRGGGGGAGGYRSTVTGESSGGGGSAESKLSLTSGTGYTVTVGAGGASAAVNVRGVNGSNSVFGAITATGGGGGGHQNFSSGVGQTGGSGGGGGISGGAGDRSAAGGSGTTNQGYAGGGSRTDNATYGNAGGGGGAGAVGATVTGSSTVGTGGNGVASTITGSSVTRAGGGGGGADATATSGVSGGSGGGGLGAYRSSIVATAGSVNTGSGGGGAGYTSMASGAGGSGIVIVRYDA
jgi:hypothetical protein